MVIVRQPFWSGWASGSLAKTITCRAMGHQRFCMHRFRHTQHKRSPAQIWAQERFAKKISLMKQLVQISNLRSARLNMNALGISILGADHRIMRTLSELPPME